MCRILTLITVCCLLGGAPLLVYADVSHSGDQWSRLAVTGGFGQSPWRYYLSSEARLSMTQAPTFGSNVNRVALGYVINSHWSLWQGFDYTISNTSSGRKHYENRPWQQIVWTINSHWDLRSRLEERFRINATGMALRLRERLRYRFTKINNYLRPVVFDEVFLYLRNSNWVTPRFFDQNRFFAGINWTPTQHLAFLVGYMNQYQLRSPISNMDHIALIYCTLSP